MFGMYDVTTRQCSAHMMYWSVVIACGTPPVAASTLYVFVITFFTQAEDLFAILEKMQVSQSQPPLYNNTQTVIVY